MRGLVLVLLVGAAGCFTPKYGNGDLRCGAGAKQCPDGWHCASDSTCWKNGSDPGSSSADMAMSTETGDMAGLGDMAPTGPDMTPPATYPPAAVWTSCGGGSATASSSGAQLNMSIGASDIAGTATGSNGATITFGFFSNDIY